ncbi:MAG: BsuBI/PstI family type II restriction endonuclease [Saprospiraceae bacterium]
MSRKYLRKSAKAEELITLIEEAIVVLLSVGIPMEGKTERTLERMAMAFLAVAGVNKMWKQAKGLGEKRFLKTREIISFVNANFDENISSGSYDDIRRKDLKILVLAGLILNSAENPQAATNDPTRAYALAPDFTELIRSFGSKAWEGNLSDFMKDRIEMKELLGRKRQIEKNPIILPNGKYLEFSSGLHNVLQKRIIEDFLPRFGKGCQVLYVGDTADEFLYVDKEALKKLHFFELSHNELPDIIAYNQQHNWLFLIEAVHSIGSINELRVLELKRLTQNCKAEIIYVTAFLTKSEFRKWAAEIAWETEAWIAENPDHLIHFNGDKFLGPYKK